MTTQDAPTRPAAPAIGKVCILAVPGQAPAPGRAGLFAAGLILAWAAANLVYLLAGCPLDLAPDEAHYWDWSRHPDWCYYSKGPLVAWLIRGSTELFGGAAVALTGTMMPAVRLPAVACNALLLAAVYRLSLETYRRPRLALTTVACALTLPPVTAGAVVMTIDPPFLCCWAWACVFARRAAADDGLWSWAAAGVLSAAGLLAKYTMLLFPVCVGLYLLADRGRRVEFRRPGFWMFLGLAAAGGLPIVIWNTGHDWIGLWHVETLAAGGETGPEVNPVAFAEYLAGQAGFLVGYWFVAWAAAVVAARPGQAAGRREAFLWWASAPVWLVFAAAAWTTRGQANWPAAGYITGLVLAVAWVGRQVTFPDANHRRLARALLVVGVLCGLSVVAALRYPSLARPALTALAGPPREGRPAPLRDLDPTCRLCGWRTLAEAVDRARDRVKRATGEDPVIATETWATPGELGFYCWGNPQVYSFGTVVADRHSQYDVWRPNPVADAQAFRGRTFVYVGASLPDADRVFDRAELPVEVTASDGGIPVAAWKVWVFYGFRGFPPGYAGRWTPGY